MKVKTHIQKLFDSINGGDCVDSAEEAQEIAEGLLLALKHAQVRLNAIPHDYEETGFSLIRAAIAKAEGRQP